MLFHISFYVFSIFLSYFDCKKRISPNNIALLLLIFLLLFGFLEDMLNIYSFFLSFLVLVFFISLLLLKPKMILGGGDIKYMMLVALYINPFLFPHFLLSTGLIQTLFLLYFTKILKRRTAPMVPAMFLSVILIQLFNF